jgi:hypothetical protein
VRGRIGMRTDRTRGELQNTRIQKKKLGNLTEPGKYGTIKQY